MLIKDKIALGTVVGVLATIPQILLNYISVSLGFAKYYDFQISASIYLYKSLTYKLSGIILGGVVWELMAAALGVLTVYLLYLTGKDYWWLKGILISNTIMFIIIYGFYYALGAPKIVPWDLETNWSILIENLVFGTITSLLACKLGDFKTYNQ